MNTNEKEMGLTLAFRPDETVAFYSSVPRSPRGNVFAVAMIDFHLPNHAPGAAVVASAYFPKVGGWGWIHIDADTKERIGDLLAKHEAPAGRWYYIDVYHSGTHRYLPPVSASLPGAGEVGHG